MASKKPAAKVSTPDTDHLLSRIAELEHTITLVEAKQRETDAANAKRGGLMLFLRRLLIVLLIVLCGLSSTMSISSIWVKRNITNTDIWVSKTSQLIQDPAIRASISTALTDQLFTQADVQANITQILPDKISGLAGPLTSSLKTAVNGRVNDAIRSEAFTTFWANASRSAHAGIMQSLENGGTASKTTEDKAIMYINDERLVLSLRPVFAAVQERLVSRGLDFIGKINVSKIGGEITLMQIKNMPRVLMAVDFINKAAVYLFVSALLFGAAAIALSVSKRRTLMAIGWTVATLMVLVVQTINFARYPLIKASLDALAAAKTDAANAAYGIITSDLVVISRTFLVMALLIVIAGFMSGNSKPAVFIKQQLGKLMHTNSSQNSFIRWIRGNSGYIFAGLGTVAALLLVFPFVHGTPIYPITVVSITVLISLLVAAIKQGAAEGE